MRLYVPNKQEIPFNPETKVTNLFFYSVISYFIGTHAGDNYKAELKTHAHSRTDGSVFI